MSVCSGNSSKSHRYEKMVEDKQYFEVGEMFLYPPESGSNEILVEVKDEADCLNFRCSKECGLWYWCCNREKYGGTILIPACTTMNRKDGKSVYFVKVDH